MTLSDSHADAAAMLLSMAASLPPKISVSTPLTQTITTLVPAQSGMHTNRHVHQEPLIYVGVSLDRSAAAGGRTWGMTLFRMGEYLIVGGVQQEITQKLTIWAWATVTPPKMSNGGEFRSSFGPLYHTSLLQLVPGDVILSINGKSHLDASMWDAASRLDILAVRLESARRAAHQVLLSNWENVQYRAAQAAFQTIEPFLTRSTIPTPCQRQLFPPSPTTQLQSTTRIVSEDSVSSKSHHERKRSHDDAMHLPLLQKENVTETQFQQWLETRKNQWRSDRTKRQRLLLYESSKPAPQQYGAEPLEFLCFQLVRELDKPWGIHVSRHDRHFLGVGNVNDGVAVRTSWAWATTNTVPAALLNIRDERSIRSIFESQPFHSRSLLQLEIGDFIFAVSGRPISSFASLQDIASYMTHSVSLMIIAVRHRASSEVAQLAARQGKPATEVTGLAFQSLMPILYRSPTAMASLFHPQPVSVYRKPTPPLSIEYRNPLFRDDKDVPILYEDQGDVDDSGRAFQFLPLVDSESFPSWLKNRKATWREQWSSGLPVVTVDHEWCDDGESSISTDFWTCQGYSTFSDWLTASTFRWKQSYSWNRKKRERLAKECEEVVHFPSYGSIRNDDTLTQTRHWLRVRKQQWRLLRRKRQRRLEGQLKIPSSSTERDSSTGVDEDTKLSQSAEHLVALSSGSASPRSSKLPRQPSGEMTIIDAFLEEQERKQQMYSKERPPLDISFLFDASLGAPDDVVAHCLEFLPRTEHAKLLCISAITSEALKEREEVWRQLCPSYWVLPRRPRKRWHDVYLTKIHDKVTEARKWADDFLNKAADILFQQDNLTKIERLVKQGEKRADFDINYISGVVCERNSLLNLAAIYSRTKVVRWLAETKGADIETFDRGGFTPLLNAAWVGNRQLVRYLLSHGADRTKIGMYHYFTGINKPDFKGLNAEGWARKKGHHDLAELIRLGL